MVKEVAVLQIKVSQEENFENDFVVASQYISGIQGYLGHSLQKCIEVKNKYILLVDWQRLEDHEIGFRKSEEYLKWKQLLHSYYEPFPVVEHYVACYDNQSEQL